MPEPSVWLPGLSLVIALVAAVGTVIAFVGNRNKGLSEVQASTIEALQAQNTAQEKQIAILENKIVRLEGTFATLRITLQKRRGLMIEVNDDLITITDQRTGMEQSVRINLHSGELKMLGTGSTET